MLKMTERVLTLSKMKKGKLDLSHTEMFSEPVLQAASDTIAAFGLEEQIADWRNMSIQRELIKNPPFAEQYQELLEGGMTNEKLREWLKAAEEFGDTFMNYQAKHLLMLDATALPSVRAKYEFLKYFSDSLENAEDRENLLLNFQHFYDQKQHQVSSLTEEERRLLLLPYFDQYIRIDGNTVLQSMRLLNANPAIQDLLQFLHDENVGLGLSAQDLYHLQWLQKEAVEKLKRVYGLLGIDGMEDFLEHWLENRAVSYDLDWFVRHNKPFSKKQKEEILGTRLGYLNMLYSGKLNIPFERLYGNQIDVLVYAIEQKKQHFLELVSENFELFASLDYNAMLFDPEFYGRCNLNTLTVKNLKESQGDKNQRSQLHLLEPKEYTFAELKTLRYAKSVYIELYKRLEIPRVDDRLVVIRQLLKKGLLSMPLSEAELSSLATRFSTKPLSAWREKELGHISGLKSIDSVRIMMTYEKIGRFLPEIQTWEEAVFAARNAEQIQVYTTWQQVLDNIFETDQDWKHLAIQMDLSDAFMVEYRQSILQFLLREGAEMSWMYYEATDKKEAFQRIVQAELMGEFHTLKYYKDDLRREINYPIGEMQKACWAANTSFVEDDIEVEETDDFFTTLRLGELPYSTCLSYVSGSHNECLLAGFDSNKKILLAKKGGTVVGRAVIRLTKGSFQAAGGTKETSNSTLEFVDLLNEEQSQTKPAKRKEMLTLFLERPYTAGVSNQEKSRIKRMFVKRITKKAEQLGAVPVLAECYYGDYEEEQYVRMGYYMYISQSKSGAQYLDSLTGSVSASQAGRYQKEELLLPQEILET